MKILFVADVPLLNPSSGSEQMLKNQTLGLSALGMDVFAITRQQRKPRNLISTSNNTYVAAFRADTSNIFHFISALSYYPAMFYKKFHNGIPFQAVVSHQPINYQVLSLLNHIGSIPMLYNFHSPSHEEYQIVHSDRDVLINFLPCQARRLLERWCVKRAYFIMVESEYMKDKLINIHYIDPLRIIVNPGGVDVDEFNTPLERNSIKQELNIPLDKVSLLTIRNLEPRMGLDNLIRAMVMLKERKIPVYLIIGGDGTERGRLAKLITDLNLEAIVDMRGYIPAGQLPKYYGGADLFILPTRKLEGFGLVTIESMACGTPVLGTPVGGTEEILSLFDPNFLFKDTTPVAIADGIEWGIRSIFKKKESYNCLRNRCREFVVANYTWDRHIQQLKSIIEKIVERQAYERNTRSDV